jgi:hypothetical protein
VHFQSRKLDYFRGDELVHKVIIVSGKREENDFVYRKLSLLAPIWTPNTGINHITVLSAEARTIRGTGSDGPRPGRRSISSPRMSGRTVSEA